MELYKKHRPKTLRRVIGNDVTVKSLAGMIEKEAVPHTILFHGPSGCGKTTLARILGRAMGCHKLDWTELNSSSFRGIDSIREVSRSMLLKPMHSLCRIWLIDECHKLTNDAQNAALKMLEDTPKHVFFFLCTTNPKKLITPILTRCCDMPVSLLSRKQLEKLVRRVARAEGLSISDGLLYDLVGCAQGSPRTALVLLDKIANLDEGDRAGALAMNEAEDVATIDLCRALYKRKPWAEIANILKKQFASEESIRRAILGYARAVLLSGKTDHQAYLLIDIFKEPFHDSGAAGLVAACFEAVLDE